MPSIDWSISVGNLIGAVISLVSVVAAIIRVYVKLDRCLHRMHTDNRERIAVIESKFDLLERHLKERR